jgi:glycosyltransferase involved in cell wall biosynthesis
MKISIITVTHNAVDTLQDTIDSVASQDYPNVEHIIVDGKSEDSTLDIIQKNTETIGQWVSEKDEGIYDAMNKGIQMASGDVIAFLNADDFYTYPQAVGDMVQKMKDKDVDSCYADLEYVSAGDKTSVIRKWRSGEYHSNSFNMGWMPPHPTFFVKKEIYEKYGNFNLDLGTAADYEIMLRFLHKYQISATYLPKTIIKMRAGGVSNRTLFHRIAANKNDRKAWLVNNLKPQFYTLIFKPLRKIGQFVRSS